MAEESHYPKKNSGKGALLFGAAGAIIGGIRDGRRGAAKYGAAGVAIGGGTGAILTKGQYILPPGQLRLAIEGRWTVPATMLAAAAS